MPEEKLVELFPPVIDTYIPAFVKNNCRVYFSISEYNSFENIKCAQVSITDLKTNLTALNDYSYPSEIKLTRVYKDENINTPYCYYITLDNTDFKDNIIINDNYYKVQIRFVSADVVMPSSGYNIPQAIDSWLASNLDYFSEWSSISLLRKISQPELLVSGFDITSGSIAWTNASNNVVGKLTFEDENETETLDNYRIKLYNYMTIEKKEYLLMDSDIIYTNKLVDSNSFIYPLKYNLEKGLKYILEIEYKTSNGYSDSYRVQFYVNQDSSKEAKANISIIEDANNGRFGVHITQRPDAEETSVTAHYIIRRLSSETNFTIWEDVFEKEYTKVAKIDDIWYDTTITSGAWYYYAIQAVEGNRRGQIKQIEEPVMIILDDMFLTTADQQLKIEFDPNVSSLKRMLSESKVETLGAQYPFIRRNGAMSYYQIPISGKITAFMDEDNLFVDDKDIYGTDKIKQLTEDYN